MKKIFLIAFILYSIHAFADNSKSRYVIPNILPPDTTVLSQILSLPLQSYIGKPVDSLLNVLPGTYTDRDFMVVKVGRAKGLWQAYYTSQANNCTIEIFIDTFHFMSFPNYTKTTTWDMTLAKRETIAFIKVYKNNLLTCVYGCNNPNYYW